MDNNNNIFLSIIIPAYNEEHRLPLSLNKIFAFLREKDYPFEILVIENGSTDDTYQIAQSIASQNAELKVIREEYAGKGNAVRRGILEANGLYCFLCDADLSMPIDELDRFLPPHICEADIFIGSRDVVGAVRYDEPTFRRIPGRIFNLFIQAMILPGIQDTQCGFKCFRGDGVKEVFKRQTIDGWAFDVEILAIAKQLGYKIVEIPISWYFNSDSKINMFRDAPKMFFDILYIRKRILEGFYK